MRDHRAVAEPREAVHDRLRVDDDLDAVVRQVEEEVGLDDLESLVHSVAESIVIFAPIAQVGCASASCTVTSESVARAAAERAAARREDEALRLAELRALEQRQCSLSTGMSRPPPRSCAASASAPAATRLSLFASASVRRAPAPTSWPAVRRSRRRVEDDVGPGLLEQAGRVTPQLGQGREAVDRGGTGGRCHKLELVVGRDHSGAGARSSRSRRGGPSVSSASVCPAFIGSGHVGPILDKAARGAVSRLISRRAGRRRPRQGSWTPSSTAPTGRTGALPRAQIRRTETRTVRLTRRKQRGRAHGTSCFADCRLDLAGLRNATLERVGVPRLPDGGVRTSTPPARATCCSSAARSASRPSRPSRSARVELRGCDLAGLRGAEHLRGARLPFRGRAGERHPLRHGPRPQGLVD